MLQDIESSAQSEPIDFISKLLQEFDKKIDLGDADQVQLYTEILAERNLNIQFPKICKLMTLFLQKSKSERYKNSVTDQNRRLISHLQQCVSVFEAFASNDESTISKVTSMPHIATKLIPKDFFQNEANHLRSFLPQFQSESPDIPIKLTNIKKIRQEIELTTSIDDIKNGFGEICSLFEFTSLINDVLIQKNIENSKIREKNEKSN